MGAILLLRPEPNGRFADTAKWSTAKQLWRPTPNHFQDKMRSAFASIIAMMIICSPLNGFNGRTVKEADVELAAIRGKVFRSDSGKPISNSYVLLASETNPAGEHFDTRTNANGEYVLKGISPGSYTISIYAWFRKKRDVPCQNPQKERTAEGDDVTVEYQRKSGAFMEIITRKRLSIDAGKQKIKNFDLSCK